MANEKPEREEVHYLIMDMDRHQPVGMYLPFALEDAVNRALAAAAETGRQHSVYKLVGSAQSTHKADWIPVDDQEGSTT